MTLRTIANSRLIDWEKLDNAPADISAELDLKEDKVAWKWLSENDYTDAEKSKLAWIDPGAEVNAVDSVNWDTWAVVLDKTDVGLWNVDNTSDASKPVSTATQTALDDLKANKDWETITNATVNWVTLSDWWAATDFLNEEWNYVSIAWGWDMTKAVYDPNTIEADAFDQDNMVDGTTNKNYTATEQNKVANIPADTNSELADKQDILAEWAFVDWDKTKLDWIEALAEVNPTEEEANNTIWAATIITWLVSWWEITVNAWDDSLLDQEEAVYYIQWVRYVEPEDIWFANWLWVGETARRYWFDAAWRASQAWKYSDVQKQTILPVARINSVQWESWTTASIQNPIDQRYFIDQEGWKKRKERENVFLALYTETGWEF